MDNIKITATYRGMELSSANVTFADMGFNFMQVVSRFTSEIALELGRAPTMEEISDHALNIIAGQRAGSLDDAVSWFVVMYCAQHPGIGRGLDVDSEGRSRGLVKEFTVAVDEVYQTIGWGQSMDEPRILS